MNIENLTEEELKDIILKKQLEWIKICQYNFLVFAESVWQDFIYRKTKDPKKYGHHQIIAESFQEIADGDAKRLIISNNLLFKICNHLFAFRRRVLLTERVYKVGYTNIVGPQTV